MAASALRLLRGAADDVARAATWYSERSTQAADGFLVEIERAPYLIRTSPGSGSPSRRKTRRFVLDRYPFSVVYRFEDDVVWIVAVAHAKRRPDYWRHR